MGHKQNKFDLYIHSFRLFFEKETLKQVISSDFSRNIAGTFVTRLFVILISLVTTIIVARVLGPEGRGLYAVAIAIGAIGVQFGNLGLHASNTFYVAQDQKLLPILLSNSLVISFSIGSIIGAIALLVFFTYPTIAPLQGQLLILALLWIPFGLAFLLLQNLLIGIHKIRAYNVIELTTKILCVTLILFIVGLNAITVERIFLLGLLTLVLGLYWTLIELKKNLKQIPKPSFTLFKEYIQYGLKAYIAAFFAFIVLQSDILMVKYLLGSEQAGFYSIATTMANMVYMLPVITGTILFPRLSAQTLPRKKLEITIKVGAILGIIMTIITGGSVAIAHPLVKILFGYNYLPAVPAFVWLMPGILLLSINTIFMNYFASIGIPFFMVYSPGVAAILNIGLNLYLIPTQGIIGASISSSVSYSLMFLLSIIYLNRGFKKYNNFALS